MNNLLDIKSPAQKTALAHKADYGLDHHGLMNLHQVYWNLPVEALYEETGFRREGQISRGGPLIVNTGKHTARSANDKFVVREDSTGNHVWWGEYNRPFNPDKFNEVYDRLMGFLQGRDLFVQDCYAGADPNHRLPVRVITEFAWHSVFARTMFIPCATKEEYQHFVPEFTVIAVPSFKSFPQIDATPGGTFILLNFDQKVCIIGNTAYAGEIKKSVFTIMNYLLPLDGVLSMHCSANLGKDGDTALFFGLSGTGKTTLSADPKRGLIGDDEHGWSDEGIFNIENGCYAKVIALSPTAEPQIYACTSKFGSILENVIYDPVTRRIDLDDETITENTRASYPLTFIDNAVDETTGTIHLKATFDNANNNLWPGAFVNVVLKVSTMSRAVVVPTQAIMTGQNGQYVFIIKEDLSVEMRNITIKHEINGESIVEQGLKAGERVVTDGQLRLAPGSRVSIKNPSPEK